MHILFQECGDVLEIEIEMLKTREMLEILEMVGMVEIVGILEMVEISDVSFWISPKTVLFEGLKS